VAKFNTFTGRTSTCFKATSELDINYYLHQHMNET